MNATTNDHKIRVKVSGDSCPNHDTTTAQMISIHDKIIFQVLIVTTQTSYSTVRDVKTLNFSLVGNKVILVRIKSAFTWDTPALTGLTIGSRKIWPNIQAMIFEPSSLETSNCMGTSNTLNSA